MVCLRLGLLKLSLMMQLCCLTVELLGSQKSQISRNFAFDYCFAKGLIY
jgi:hypothetical protein